MKDLEKTLSTYFVDKAPKIPADLQRIIVNYGPYLIALSVAMGLLGLISSFGWFSFMRPMGMYGMYGGGMYQMYVLYTLVTVILSIAALPGLFAKKKAGWQYMLYNTFVSAAFNILTFNILGLIIGTGLGCYILFQVRHHYK